MVSDIEDVFCLGLGLDFWISTLQSLGLVSVSIHSGLGHDSGLVRVVLTTALPSRYQLMEIPFKVCSLNNVEWMEASHNRPEGEFVEFCQGHSSTDPLPCEKLLPFAIVADPDSSSEHSHVLFPEFLLQLFHLVTFVWLLPLIMTEMHIWNAS